MVNTSPAAPPRTGKLQPSEGKVRQPCCKPGPLDKDLHLLSYLAGQVLLCSGSSMRHTANCVSSWQALQELSLQAAPPLFIPSIPPQGLCTCSFLCRKPRGLAGSQQSELSSRKHILLLHLNSLPQTPCSLLFSLPDLFIISTACKYGGWTGHCQIPGVQWLPALIMNK